MHRLAVIQILLCTLPTAHAQTKDTDFADAKLLWTLPWDADWVTAVSFIGNDRVAAGNKLGGILVWSLPSTDVKTAPLPTHQFAGHTNEVARLLTTPDQSLLISASLDHSIKYWQTSAQAGEPGIVVLNERARFDAEFRKKKPPPPVEAKVAVQKFSRELLGHKDWVLGLSMTPNGKTLVSAADRTVGPKKEKQGEIIVWDLPAAREIRRWSTKGWPWGLAVSPDGKTVIASERIPLIFDSGALSALKMWHADTGEMKVDLSKDVKERMAAAAYSPDGKWLALCRGGEANGLAGKVTFLDPATGKKLRETSPGHQDGATDLAFHPDGKHVFSAGRDTTVKIWRLGDGMHVRDLGKGRGGQFKDWICALAISPDGKLLAAADMAGAVQIWSLTR